MTDSPAVDLAHPARPLPFVFVCGILPALTLGGGWLGSLAWSFVVSVACRQALPIGVQRHAAGGAVALSGSLAVVFLEGWGLRPWAILLFVPGLVAWGLERAGRGGPVRKLRGVPILAAVVYIVSVLVLYVVAARVGPLPPINDDFQYGLHAVSAPEPLTETERKAAIDVIRASLLGAAVDADALPPRLHEEHRGRVWVTLFRQTKRGRVARGMAGPGPLYEGLAEAAALALKNAPSRSKWVGGARVTVIVDLGGTERVLKPNPKRRLVSRFVTRISGGGRFLFDPIVYEAEPGLDGFIASGPGGKEGVVLPADDVVEGWLTPRSRRRRYRTHNFDVLHKRLVRRAGLPRGTERGAIVVRRFRTYSFGQPDPTSDRTVELYRGNVLLPGEPTEELLLERISLAGEWLLGTVEEGGRFDYEYFPNKDDHGHGYNEVRHAGSVYGLFHMVHLARSEPTMREDAEDYLRAGVLAMERVYSNLGSPPGVPESAGYIAFLEGDDGEKSNSGAAALTLLSFLERPSPDDTDDAELKAGLWRDGDDALMRGLAMTLVKMIDDEGKVYQRWPEALAAEGVEKEPLYYPGEVMLALVRYHQRTGEIEWLDAAEKIGRRQIPYSRSWMVVPDHWVMQALDLLDEADPEKSDEWRRGAYAMGRRYVKEQFASPGLKIMPGPRQRPPFPDYRGGYRRAQEVPRTTRAASRGEAIGGVARIAWRHGDPSGHWERSLIEGARHLMEQQYVVDNSFFLPRPAEVRGAIRMGIVDMHCRIDNNQHGVVALGNALDALRRQAAR